MSVVDNDDYDITQNLPPDSWVCPTDLCLELITDITAISDKEYRGLCPKHGAFRYIGGDWVR